MNVLGTIRAFHTANFSVVIDAVEDYDCDLSFDETGEVLEQLESGELQCFAVRARVTCNGKGSKAWNRVNAMYNDPAYLVWPDYAM